MLGNGAAASFQTSGDLADSLVKAFVERSPALSPLGPGGAVGGSWRDIVRDLVRLAYGVEVILLTDLAANGDVIVEVAAETTEAFFPAAGMEPPQGLQVALIGVVGGASASGAAGVYPIFAMDPKAFLRAPPQDRQALARRVFRPHTASDGVQGSLRDEATPVRDRVVQMLGEVLALTGPAPGLTLDLHFLADACARKGYQIEEKLVNLRGRCYGALVGRRAAAPETPKRKLGAGPGAFFFPVRESACAADGVPVRFGPRPAALATESELLGFLSALNAHAVQASEAKEGREEVFERTAVLVGATGQRIGFAVGDPAGSFLLAYHAPAPLDDGGTERGSPPRGGIPRLSVPYDPLHVDTAIISARGGAPLTAAPEMSAETAAAAFTNRLYRLFVAEFAAVMKGERNDGVRKRLHAAIAATKFGAPKSVAAFRAALAAILKPFPDDLRTMGGLLQRELARPARNATTSVARALDASVFGFDYTTLKELRPKPHQEIVAAVRRLIFPRVEVTRPGAPSAAPPENLFAACTVDTHISRPQCYGGKLLVPADRLDGLIDILAADLANPGKAVQLTLAAGVFDERILARRPGETLRLIEAPSFVS